jgi:hypothetical protein
MLFLWPQRERTTFCRASVIKCKVHHPTQSLHTSSNLPAEGNDIEMLRRLIGSNLTGTFVCAQAVGKTNEWSIGHGRKAAVLNMKKTKKKKKKRLVYPHVLPTTRILLTVATSHRDDCQSLFQHSLCFSAVHKHPNDGYDSWIQSCR